MRLVQIVLVLGSFLVVGCATNDQPRVDAAGLVRITSWEPGNIYAHPERSIDHYDDILLTDVALSYGPNQKPLSQDDQQRLRMMAFEIVARQIPAAGQLAVSKPGPCTVKLGVELNQLEFSGSGSSRNGSTAVHIEFRDSLNNDPIVRYEQRRELSLAGTTTKGPELERLGATLEIVAEDVRLRLRDALPLAESHARASEGCKGRIGEVRKQTKAAKAG